MTSEPKLSAELFQGFQRYKRATGKVIKWLALSSENTEHEGQSWALEDLKLVAKIVRQKAIMLPENIFYAFQDAIESRAEISQYFKQHSSADDDKTRFHEFFTPT